MNKSQELSFAAPTVGVAWEVGYAGWLHASVGELLRWTYLPIGSEEYSRSVLAASCCCCIVAKRGSCTTRREPRLQSRFEIGEVPGRHR
jgi:hypothetical protein